MVRILRSGGGMKLILVLVVAMGLVGCVMGQESNDSHLLIQEGTYKYSSTMDDRWMDLKLVLSSGRYTQRGSNGCDIWIERGKWEQRNDTLKIFDAKQQSRWACDDTFGSERDMQDRKYLVRKTDDSTFEIQAIGKTDWIPLKKIN